jgi:hypothetical protein
MEQPFFRFHSGYFTEIASLMRGERLAGLPRTEEAKAFWNANEFRLTQVGVLETEALYCASQGRFHDALAKVGEALSEAEEVSLRKPALLRFRAYLLRKSGALGALVEACYCEAIECAQKQGNKFDELQSVTHFARWLKSQDHAEQANTVLSQAYKWFYRGFRHGCAQGGQGAAGWSERKAIGASGEIHQQSVTFGPGFSSTLVPHNLLSRTFER